MLLKICFKGLSFSQKLNLFLAPMTLTQAIPVLECVLILHSAAATLAIAQPAGMTLLAP